MSRIPLYLRFAARSLSRDWTFSFAAASTLALGVAASVAALSLANKIGREPLPGIPNQENLAVIRKSPPRTGTNFAFSDGVRTESDGTFGTQFDPIGQVAGYVSRDVSVAVPGKQGRVINSATVSADYFKVLGVVPTHGSFIPPAELAAGEGGVVLSDHSGPPSSTAGKMRLVPRSPTTARPGL